MPFFVVILCRISKLAYFDFFCLNISINIPSFWAFHVFFWAEISTIPIAIIAYSFSTVDWSRKSHKKKTNLHKQFTAKTRTKCMKCVHCTKVRFQTYIKNPFVLNVFLISTSENVIESLTYCKKINHKINIIGSSYLYMNILDYVLYERLLSVS